MAETCDTLQTDRSGPQPVAPAAGAVSRDSALLLGIVADRQVGTAIPGVVIRVTGRVTAGVLSDSAGGFVLPPLEPGKYRVLVARIGYRSFQTVVDLAPGSVQRVRATLRLERCHFGP